MSEILITTDGALGHIRLNRPKALNALSLDMIQGISTALERFANDPAIAAVLITGEGERGLCAGGDIRTLYDHRSDDPAFGMHYFQHEYRMNYQISVFPKPYIAFMEGITMGGGVGVSAHGNIRVVTEQTRLAMPETGIGFFPDIGASWLLSRAPGELGTYMALSGQIVSGADALLAGLADECVESQSLPLLQKQLAALPPTATRHDLLAVVQSFSSPRIAPLAADIDDINQCFKFDKIEDIIAALEKTNTDFTNETAFILRQRSPTSLKVALRFIRLGRQSHDLKTCLQREYAACQQVLKSHDLYEGIRAAVVDKDRNPHWVPQTLKEVTNDMVDAYFQPVMPPLF